MNRFFMGVSCVLLIGVCAECCCGQSYFSRMAPDPVTNNNGCLLRGRSSANNIGQVVTMPEREIIDEEEEDNAGDGGDVNVATSGYVTSEGSISTVATTGSSGLNPDGQSLASVTAIQQLSGSLMLLATSDIGFCGDQINTDVDCNWLLTTDRGNPVDVEFDLAASWGGAFTAGGIGWIIAQNYACTVEINNTAVFTMITNRAAGGNATGIDSNGNPFWQAVPPMNATPGTFSFSVIYASVADQSRIRFYGGQPANPNPGPWTWMGENTSVGPVFGWSGTTMYAGSISSTATFTVE